MPNKGYSKRDGLCTHCEHCHLFCCFEAYALQGAPDALKTSIEGITWLLNPKARQPIGFAGSQVTK